MTISWQNEEAAFQEPMLVNLLMGYLCCLLNSMPMPGSKPPVKLTFEDEDGFFSKDQK